MSMTTLLIWFDDLMIIIWQMIFLSICCGCRVSRKKYIIATIGTGIVFYGMIFVLEKITGGNPYVYYFNFLVCGICYSALVLKYDMRKKVILCLLYFSMFVQIGVIDRAIIHFARLEFHVEIPVRVIGICGLSALMLGFCVWKGRKKLVSEIPESYWYYILASSVFYYLICNLAVDYFDSGSIEGILWMLVVAFGTFVLNIGNILLCRRLAMVYEEKLNVFVNKQRQISDHQIMSETERLYQEMRNMRHELQNHIFVIQSLARLNDTEGILRYLEPMCTEKEKWKKSSIDTGNLAVNAILNQKISQAESKKIRISVDGNLPQVLPVENQELCSLLANLLNNALEASRKTTDPEIRVNLAKKKNYFCIKVSNTVLYDVLKENPELRTSKADAENHGIGIRVIRAITEKYDGFLKFSVEDGFFHAEVFLKLTPGR